MLLPSYIVTIKSINGTIIYLQYYEEWFVWVVCCFEKIIKKLSDFFLVISKSFLRSCSPSGAGTWSTERRKGVWGGGGGGGGKCICRWELVVPVNTWSQEGNEMILFTCKSRATECTAAETHCFSPTSHQKIGTHHLNSFGCGCEGSFSPKPFGLYFEHEHIM